MCGALLFEEVGVPQESGGVRRAPLVRVEFGGVAGHVGKHLVELLAVAGEQALNQPGLNKDFKRYAFIKTSIFQKDLRAYLGADVLYPSRHGAAV